MKQAGLPHRIASFAARLIPAGWRLPVLRGPLRGARWITGAAVGSGKGLSVVFNRSEPEQLAAAERLVAKDEICFDIGANVGLYTLLFSRRCRQVFAFEPVARNLSYLREHVEINRAENVTIVPVAVTDRDGTVAFQEGENWATGKVTESGERTVESVTCDRFAAAHGVMPDLMKIDVEGAEGAVLRGAWKVVAERKPVLLLSTHGESARAECLAFARAAGYGRITPLNAATEAEATEFAVCP
jgi:FkbM family methyltransferase